MAGHPTQPCTDEQLAYAPAQTPFRGTGMTDCSRFFSVAEYFIPPVQVSGFSLTW